MQPKMSLVQKLPAPAAAAMRRQSEYGSRVRALLLLTLAVGLAACSGGATSSAGTSPGSPTPIPTASQTPVATASPTPESTPAPGTFSVTGSPLDYVETAVLLQDGRVLGITDRTSTVQLYDPTTGTFSLTGKMTTERSGVTATRLPAGKVLVVGVAWNLDSQPGDPGAELYDPATGTFSLAGSVVRPRVGHTATALRDGRVLIAGGLGLGSDEDILASAEIYDPATGKFSSTGSMHTARENATATLLADGRVLVLGGDQVCCGSSPVFVGSAEIYDPATGRFSTAGSFESPLTGFTATLLPDGRILIAGGQTLDGDPLSLAQLYDPATRTFTATGSMTTGRAGHLATSLLDGRVLVVGGAEVGTAEIYDPATGRFSPTDSLMSGQGTDTATLLKDGRVLMAHVGVNPLTAELYWP
jgi:WD40 repeat protein